MSGRVLIIDGVATNRIMLRARLGAACYEALPLCDGRSGIEALRANRADTVLLDLDITEPSATDFLAQLRADPRLADTPVIAMAAPDRPDQRLAALHAGADDVLQKPVDEGALLARLRALQRRSEAMAELGASERNVQALGLAEAASHFQGRGTIALVTTRPEATLRLRKELGAHLPDRLVALGRSDALAGPAQWGDAPVPDVFLIDCDLDGPEGGLRLLSDLRSQGPTRHAAICLLAAPGGSGSSSEAMAFDLGATDLVASTIDPRELALRLAAMLRRKRRADHLRSAVRDGLRLAVIDPLTGLHNRRYAVSQLAGIVEASRTDGLPYAVMVIDLDRFKAVNDQHGHAAGDAVLVEVGRRLSRNLRMGDLLARIGGEEFLVALPSTGVEEAHRLAERLCTSIEEELFALPGGSSLRMTASIGLALAEGGARPVSGTVQADIDRADRALLAAKASGRNNVTRDRTAA